MKKAVYYPHDGFFAYADCLGNCDSCSFKFRCFTEKWDRIKVDKETFLKLVKEWGKDWVVKTGRGLD